MKIYIQSGIVMICSVIFIRIICILLHLSTDIIVVILFVFIKISCLPMLIIYNLILCVHFFLYVTWPFRTGSMMSFHNGLSCVLLSNTGCLTFPSSLYSTIYSYKPIWNYILYFPLICLQEVFIPHNIPEISMVSLWFLVQ